MYAQPEKPKENKSRAVTNAIAQKKSKVKQGFEFVDNRQKKSTQINALKRDNVNSTKLQLKQQEKDKYEPLHSADSYEPQFAKHILEISTYGQKDSENDGDHRNTVMHMTTANLRDEIRRNLFNWDKDWLLSNSEQGLETTNSYTYTEWYDGKATIGTKKHRFKARTSDVNGRNVLKAYHYQG
jgi:hypothetical protein